VTKGRKAIPQVSLPAKIRRLKEHQSRSGKPPGKGSPTRPVITLRDNGSGPDYNVRLLDRDCRRAKAISIKSSLRWIDTFKTPNGGLSVPFIDELGRFTGHCVYKWSCDPRSMIATVVSTIAKRLLNYCRRHNKWNIVKKHLKSMTGAAAYYAFTKDSHFWDRILFFSRDLEKRGNLIHRVRLFYSSKWSDNKRFVYSQVIYQTNWLLSRALQPRDKVHFYREVRGSPWRKPEDAPPRQIITDIVRSLAYAMSSI
jgi:hypothetical protein